MNVQIGEGLPHNNASGFALEENSDSRPGKIGFQPNVRRPLPPLRPVRPDHVQTTLPYLINAAADMLDARLEPHPRLVVKVCVYIYIY